MVLLQKEVQMKEREFLKQYRLEDYERPSVAVDIALFTLKEEQNNNYRKIPEKKLSLLLVKRAEPPFEGMWVLPGGFLRKKETFISSFNVGYDIVICINM